MDSIAKMVNGCVMGYRSALHAMWREKCAEVGTTTDVCWITADGSDTGEALTEADEFSRGCLEGEGTKIPRRFETHDFEVVRPNVHAANL